MKYLTIKYSTYRGKLLYTLNHYLIFCNFILIDILVIENEEFRKNKSSFDHHTTL